jgi:hypothetical protein
VGSPHMPKATFPFVTVGRWLEALFLKYSDCVRVRGPLKPVSY